MPTVRLELSYDGGGYRGFARQPGQRTVQGALEQALGRILSEEAVTTGAGRTDAGVHARGQVVTFATASEVDPDRLTRSLNALLGPEITVTEARMVADGFDARFSARWRSYRYQILNSPFPDPLRRLVTWHVPEPLDLSAMNQAATALVGEHDFSAFCRRAEGKSNLRQVLSAGWEQQAALVTFSIRANAFCHQMVRSLVGFLVEVGRGRREAEETPAILAGGDRASAGPLAPPQGLILWEVGYEG
jgi:tRNA pseudouridine38-40 synthase